MTTPSPINDLLQKRMDRKDFLKHVGIGMAMLTGAAGIIKMLQPAQRKQQLGYGSSVYGGSAKSLEQAKS